MNRTNLDIFSLRDFVENNRHHSASERSERAIEALKEDFVLAWSEDADVWESADRLRLSFAWQNGDATLSSFSVQDMVSPVASKTTSAGSGVSIMGEALQKICVEPFAPLRFSISCTVRGWIQDEEVSILWKTDRIRQAFERDSDISVFPCALSRQTCNWKARTYPSFMRMLYASIGNDIIGRNSGAKGDVLQFLGSGGCSEVWDHAQRTLAKDRGTCDRIFDNEELQSLLVKNAHQQQSSAYGITYVQFFYLDMSQLSVVHRNGQYLVDSIVKPFVTHWAGFGRETIERFTAPFVPEIFPGVMSCLANLLQWAIEGYRDSISRLPPPAASDHQEHHGAVSNMATVLAALRSLSELLLDGQSSLFPADLHAIVLSTGWPLLRNPYDRAISSDMFPASTFKPIQSRISPSPHATEPPARKTSRTKENATLDRFFLANLGRRHRKPAAPDIQPPTKTEQDPYAHPFRRSNMLSKN